MFTFICHSWRVISLTQHVFFNFVLFAFLKLMEIVESLMHLGPYCKYLAG